MKKLLLLTFFCLTSFSALSQNNSKALFYTSFDNTIGQNNTPLSYGVIYKEKYIRRFKNNHNFFLNDQFKKGSIFYRNESFYNVELKYDIVDDFVIVRIRNQKQIISIIPEKKLIKTFQIGDLKFINTKLGFIEEVTVNDKFSIYKKYKKISHENFDQSYKQHTFKEKKAQFLLYYKEKYYAIKSKRDFIKIFPNQKKTIAKYYKSNRLLSKKDFKNFVIKLMKQLQA